MALAETTIIRFKNRLTKREIEFFRGAIIEVASLGDSSLFHNHTETGFRNRYPLIQYKILNGRAALVGLGEGAQQLMQLREMLDKGLHIGYKTLEFETSSVERIETKVKMTVSPQQYLISDWLPLNQQNFRKYNAMRSSADRHQLLEQVVVGNIFSFCKSLDYTLEDHLTCTIEETSPLRTVKYKGASLLEMDAVISANINLPQYLGLGKGCSVGHGTISFADH